MHLCGRMRTGGFPATGIEPHRPSELSLTARRYAAEKAKDPVNRFVALSVPLSRRHITVPR